MNRRRRQVLRALGVGSVVTLAGCNGIPLSGDDMTVGEFGSSVAVSADGTTAIIGAPFTSYGKKVHVGSAHIFSGADGAWRQQAELEPTDGHMDDHFGGSVAMSADGSTAIVGAVGDNDPNNEVVESAYVFSKADSTWRKQTELLRNDGDDVAGFGSSVAVSADGSTAIIGAHVTDSAYIFSQADGAWRQQAKLLPKDGDEHDSFGHSVVLSADGTTAIIGAVDSGSDSAYVFSQADSTWRQQAKLVTPDLGKGFTGSVALSGDGTTFIIGAPAADNANTTNAGAAWVFSQADGTWRQQAKLVPKYGDRYDGFGDSVALSGDGTTAIIGTRRTDSAYIFSQADGAWRQQAKPLPKDSDEHESFGHSVVLSADGTTVILGSDDSGSNSAYVFSVADGTWRQQTKLLP